MPTAQVIKKRKRVTERKSAVDDSSKKPESDGARSYTVGRCDEVSDRYEKVGRRLGEGTYGIVYQAKDKVTGRYVALKRCIPHDQASDGFPVTTLREIQSLRLCSSHPNIVHLENVAVSRSGVFLVFEYCDHDLSNLIDAHYRTYQESPFQQAQVKRLLLQLLGAVKHVHRLHLIHRDIKLSNLLYTSKGLLKLADFGLSRPYAHDLQSQLTPKVASLWYRPPELLLGATSYSNSIDLWAVGCVFGELLTGQPLMKGVSELDQISQIFDCFGVPPPPSSSSCHLSSSSSSSSFWALPLLVNKDVRPPTKSRRTVLDTLGNVLSREGLELVHGLLHFDPMVRWTATQALQSPYLDKEVPRPTPIHEMPQFPRSF